MKDNFEKQIKESIEKLEYRYEPKAWDAMHKRLDTVKPVSKLPLYLAIGGAAVVTTVVIAYNLIGNKNIESSTPSSNENVELVKVERPDGNKNTIENKKASQNPISDVSFDYGNDVTNNVIDNPSETQGANNTNSSVIPNETSTTNSNTTATNGTFNTTNSTVTTPVNERVVAPKLFSEFCEGATMNINNENNVDLYIIAPNGDEVKCPAKTKTAFTAKMAGKHSCGYYQNGTFTELSSFIGEEKPHAEIEVLSSDEKYDARGLPVTTLYTNDLGSNYSWNVEGVNLNGKEVNVHLFKKGSHTAKLTITGANGCVTSTSRKIMVNESYNLIAMNSFVPNDADPAVNTFMPYGLKLRNTSFTLIIIDPKDGHVVYETSDASNGWDGIDRQIGQLVPFESAYIWKVVLDNPEPNESPEYSGTVIPIARRR